MDRDAELEFRLDRAKQIQRAMLNKGWTKSHLASKTGYDERTIRNLLAGQEMRDQTVIDVSQALGLEARIENDIDTVECADNIFGGYLRSTHKFYEGFYYLYRRSFTRDNAIFRGVVEVRWDDSDERFAFSEYYEADPDEENGVRAHKGALYMSSYTNLVHLLTIFEGSLRVITVTKMRQSDGVMRGTIATQCEDIAFFQPTVSPVVLKRLKTYSVDKVAADIGLLPEAASDYAFAVEQLETTEERVVKLRFAHSQVGPARRASDRMSVIAGGRSE